MFVTVGMSCGLPANIQLASVAFSLKQITFSDVRACEYRVKGWLFIRCLIAPESLWNAATHTSGQTRVFTWYVLARQGHRMPLHPSRTVEQQGT